MSSRNHKLRKLRVESLEKRVMLDGNLTATVTAGVLVITGDAKANGVTVSPLTQSSSTGTVSVVPGAYVVQPDATTTVNKGKAGVPVVETGVQAGMTFDLGGGDDAVTLQGAAGVSTGPVSIQSGAGDDSLQISNIEMSSLSVVSSSGQDTLDVANCVIDNTMTLQAGKGGGSAALTNDQIGVSSTTAAAATASVSLVSLSSTNFGLTLRGTRVGHSSAASFDSAGGTVDIGDSSSIGGGITVTSQGPLNFTMDNSASAVDTYLKFSPADDSQSTVDIENSSIGGALTIAGKGPTGLTVSGVQAASATITIKMSDASATTFAKLSNVTLQGDLDESITGPADVSTSNVSAADMYLKLDGISGERITDTTNLDALTMTGGLYVTSSVGQQFVLDGTQSHDSQITIDNSDASSPSTINVGDVNEDGEMDLTISGPANVTTTNVDAVDMYLKLDGITGESVADTTNLDALTITGGLYVTSTVQDGLTVDGVDAVDMYLKLDGITGESVADTTNLDSLTITGGLYVTSTAQDGLTVDGVDAVDMYLKLDGITGESVSDSTNLDQLTVTGGLYVTSKVQDTFSVDEVSAVDMYLKLDGIKGESVADTTNLDSLTITGGLYVTSSVQDGLSVNGVQADDIFIKLDGNGATFTDQTALDSITIPGGLFVTGNVVDDLTIKSIQGGDITIKSVTADAADRSSLAIADMDSDGTLDIEYTGPVDISITGGTGGGTAAAVVGVVGGTISSQAVDMYLKLTALAGQASPSSVTIADLDLDGVLDVISRGALNFTVGQTTNLDGTVSPAGGVAAVDIYMKITSVQGAPNDNDIVLNAVQSQALSVELGSGDDTLAISNSAFTDSLYLDGGAGNNSLSLQQVEQPANTVIIDWEIITGQ